MKVNVYNDGEMVRSWDCDSYEAVYECGYENVYVEKYGIRRKAVTVGNFGYSDWNYEVER